MSSNRFQRRKVLAITSIRSDYNLLSMLYRKIHVDPEFEFSILVAGAHLSPAHGLTVTQIESDGLPVFARIESLLSADTRASRLKSAGILLTSCIDQVAAYDPDLIIFAGDREDVLVGAMLGAFLDIPTLHFFGGDHALDGIVDNAVRHAASKLSSLHFVSTQEHGRRLVAMGEAEQSVFVVGTPAIDRLREEPLLDAKELLRKHGAPPAWERFAIVIFHPVLGEEASAGEQFVNILTSLRQIGLPALVSYPNIDAGHHHIVAAIEAIKSDEQFVFYHNLANADFVNLMRAARLLVGNSSCGIVEAPFLKLGVVNAGRRQTGRAAVGNVVFTGTSQAEIVAALERALSDEFQIQLASTPSPYGDGYATERAFALIKSLNWKEFLRKYKDPLQERR